MFEDIELDDIKSLALTKSEALYLSENITVLMEFGAGKYQAPGRPLFASARVAVPLEIIQKIGFAVLVTTQREDAETEVSVEFTVAELLILRECCDSGYDSGCDCCDCGCHCSPRGGGVGDRNEKRTGV